jgi:hypothetical protein
LFLDNRFRQEKQILENSETMIPADALEKMLEASGASREQLRGQLTKLMGGQAGPFSVVYSYDTQGRVSQTRRQIFNQEHVIETTLKSFCVASIRISIAQGSGLNSEARNQSFTRKHRDCDFVNL